MKIIKKNILNFFFKVKLIFFFTVNKVNYNKNKLNLKKRFVCLAISMGKFKVKKKKPFRIVM